MGRRPLSIVVLGAAIWLAPPVDGRPAQDPTTTTAEVQVPTRDIIPEPNSGRKPRDAGDPGGAGQLAVAGAIVVALGAVGALAVRDSRRARREGQAS